MRQLLFQGDLKDLKDNQLTKLFNTFRLGTKYITGKESLKIGQIIWLTHIDKKGNKRKMCRAVVAYLISNKLFNLSFNFASSNHAVKKELNAAKALRPILRDIYRRKIKNGDTIFTVIGLVRLL